MKILLLLKKTIFTVIITIIINVAVMLYQIQFYRFYKFSDAGSSDREWQTGRWSPTADSRT